MNKYCRICWNTSTWRCPTGEAQYFETGGSYVSINGFGHEEWLFNFNWLLSGYQPNDLNLYRYSFLQPISKYRTLYEGSSFSILLYSVNPSKDRMIVAQIVNAYVPFKNELDWALNKTTQNGWLKEMQAQLKNLGLPIGPLENPSADIVNIRFKPTDVVFYNPMVIVEDNHKISRINRYQPLDWDGNYLPILSLPLGNKPPEKPEDDLDPERSEHERIRAAQKETKYDPLHVRIQNRLYRNLCARHGKNSVKYEKGFVDLILTKDNLVTFIEIKTDLTTKSCIRSALGQLLEYANYPNQKKANKLLIVGEATPSTEDETYMNYIRDTYDVLMYAVFSGHQS
jgi:hypothetical protein